VASWEVLTPAASAALSALFASLVLVRFLKSHKRHHLLWTLGLFGFAVAALLQLITNLSNGWAEGVYRVYYFLIGSLVATLGAGTVYLMNKPRVADLFLYAMLGLIAVQAVVCAATPIDTARLAAAGTETGVGIASVPMRILTVVLNIAGAGALVAGAVLSWRATKRPHNLVIIAGTALLSIGGGTAAVAPSESFAAWALYVGNLAGIALLFAGFLLSRPVGDASTAPAVATPFAPPS